MMCMLIKRSLKRFDGSSAAKMETSATQFQRNRGFQQPTCAMSAEKMRTSPTTLMRTKWWVSPESNNSPWTHVKKSFLLKADSWSPFWCLYDQNTSNVWGPKMNKSDKSDPKPELPYLSFLHVQRITQAILSPAQPRRSSTTRAFRPPAVPILEAMLPLIIISGGKKPSTIIKNQFDEAFFWNLESFRSTPQPSDKLVFPFHNSCLFTRVLPDKSW